MSYSNDHNKSVVPHRIISNYICKGDFYEVKDWTFDDNGDKANSKGYNDCLCFVLVRNGHFLYDLFHKNYEMHTGSIVIDKPNFEYTLRPSPGSCSIFNFTDVFYDAITEEYNLQKHTFFSNKNILAKLLPSTAVIDYLHYQVLQHLRSSNRLTMDILVLELLKEVIAGAGSKRLDLPLRASFKHHHLTVIERAKAYMNEHFLEDISLQQLSKHCYVSPFHFSRLFKSLTGLPPYKYLQEVRLKHAEMLVKNSGLPITDICYASGFKNTDYFSAAFTKKFKTPPSRYKVLAS